MQHSVAHCLQCSSLNISHSVAHLAQIVAQSLKCSFTNCESIAIIDDDIWHICAHSTKMLIQFFLALTSASFKHALKHW